MPYILIVKARFYHADWLFAAVGKTRNFDSSYVVFSLRFLFRTNCQNPCGEGSRGEESQGHTEGSRLVICAGF